MKRLLPVGRSKRSPFAGALHRLVLAGIVLLAGLGSAADDERAFQDGNRLYQEGRYQEALAAYGGILGSGTESGALYFNMGNCFYKTSDIGRAILFYERAARLLPGDADVKTNLAMANLSAVDKIEPQGDFLPVAWADRFVHLFHRNLLAAVVSALYAAGMLLLTGWIISRKRGLRRWCLRLSAACFAALLLFGLALYGQERERRLRRDAVILADKVDVKGAPGPDEITVFTLHAGTKVRMDQKTGDWVEIILPDRKVGWVQKEALEAI
jgi:tetratricopeptide (TPR) repeat protein